MESSDYLMLSGLQHFIFCRRQWALIHIEQQWAENYHTIDGELMHKKAHDSGLKEMRGNTIIVRGMQIASAKLGISGVCDVVEFHRNDNGVMLQGRDGEWIPFPIEYKRGKPKEHDADELQLCGQAMCLEEMLCCEITEGALFYGEPRRRKQVEFTPELRSRVTEALKEMHMLYQRGYTPKVKMGKQCRLCSLKELCVPKLTKVQSVSAYLRASLSGGE